MDRKFNYRYFDSIDCERKAYWLGYLFADGWNYVNSKLGNYTVGLEINIKDKEIVDALCKDIEYLGFPYFRIRNCILPNGKTHTFQSCSLRLCSKHMSESLNRLGMTPRKSLNLTFPKLPKKLTRHFIRGYFDGDGSITNGVKNNFYFHILGTRCFLLQLQKIIKGETGVKIGIYPKGKIYQAVVGGNKQVFTILDWLYNESTVFLSRKREKFTGFLRRYETKNEKMDQSAFIFDRRRLFNQYL